ncbi:hypothetical protein FIBSPDRAFT_925631 [Athelia psychrophila]|uniref:Galactose oxidase n=1 Tax=Athelia psychrophila TaxID=1759441 RepID=A0A166UL66_9AGAM|nr:hypothetical protein FIBSPDRAFT_925631 [Fibularhizoctonia sp. CBS 109695]
MHLLNVLSIFTFGLHAVAQYTDVSRWGQAVAVVEDVLYLHGGKTDPSNGYTYSSAPTTNDLLYLPLNVAFAASSPPWTYISGSSNLSTPQGPTLAWHTLSAFNQATVLVFGGDPGPNGEPTLSTLPDSAILLNVFDELVPAWSTEPKSWAAEPLRRVHHSASSTGGKIWLVGGEKDDGSGNALSDHWVFDPSAPSFTLLPTANGPPDIFGHTSIVLQDGTLIVFGGYSQSLNMLIPFITIWAIDTTQSTLTWTSITVASSTLPTPRRDFAAILLDNNQILIQGGADAALQNVYSDGWVLDVSQSPATWTSVAALEQLGPRYDHYAAPAASQVIFGGGYGPSSAAPAGISIYDPPSTTFVPSFIPPATPNPTQTLPGLPTSNSISGENTGTATPTNTGTSQHGSGTQTGTGSPTQTGVTTGPVTGSGSNTGSGQPTTTQGIPPTSGPTSGTSTAKKTAAIAVGTALGLMALLVGSVVTWYYVKHHRSEPTQDSHFHLLGGNASEDLNGGASSDLLAGGYDREKLRSGPSGPSTWFGHQPSSRMNPAPGLILDDGNRERRDMLADEDTREFGRLGSVYGSGRDGTGGSSFSLRSVGAAIGSMGLGVRGMLSREPSGDVPSFHNRDISEPFSDSLVFTDLDPRDIASARPLNRRETSYGTAQSYHDPFVDTAIQEDVGEDIGEEDAQSDETDDDEATRLTARDSQATLPPTLGLHTLSPLIEQASRSSNGTSTGSSQAQPPSPFESNPRSSYSSIDSRPLRRSLVDSVPLPNVPLARSDSWWDRFKGSSLLERKVSKSRSPPPAVDFRDPNPAPRLVTIQEQSTHSNSPESAEERARRRSQRYSMTSVKTAQTADSAAIERMGGMDVVQRIESNHSHQTMPSTGSGANDSSWLPTSPLSVVASSGPPSYHQDEEERPLVESPLDVESADISDHPSRSSTPPLVAPAPIRPIPVKETVLGRIHAYERRISDEATTSAPLSPGGRNTRQREETPSKSRVTVNYGLAPRASLFVANPDHKNSGSSDS